MRLTKYLAAFVGAAALAAVLGVPGGARADAMADAEALIAAQQKLPAFNPPGEPFDAKACMKDKKMMVIPLSMTNPFNVEISKAMGEAAKEVGFELKNWENQLKIDQWVQGMAAAQAGGYQLVDLQGGIPPAALGPQIDEARAKGIKVTTTHLFDVTQEIPPNLDGSARMNYTLAGKLMASWAYVKTGGKPNVVIIGSDEIVPTAPFVKSIQDTLKEYCPDCKQQHINVPVQEWATKIQPSVQSALVADPSINFVLPIYDSMSQFVVPALRITNRLGDVKIATYNGTPFVLDMIRNGEVDMDVGESLGWVGYAGVDVNMRILCGLEPVTVLNTPLYIFDKSNVEAAGVPANFNDGYGDSHLAGFRKLWGLE
ncbi:MAG: sugar ABC transporter substrate-binding protein [Alphaproteobacteria bacterium]